MCKQILLLIVYHINPLISNCLSFGEHVHCLKIFLKSRHCVLLSKKFRENIFFKYILPLLPRRVEGKCHIKLQFQFSQHLRCNGPRLVHFRVVLPRVSLNTLPQNA